MAFGNRPRLTGDPQAVRSYRACGRKVSHKTEAAAWAHVRAVARFNADKGLTLDVIVYRCTVPGGCGGWHLAKARLTT